MTNGKPQWDAICSSPEETRAFGGRIAEQLEPGGVISLEGPLGAGKTQLVKGIAEALGHHGEVSSPTFTLVHEYCGGRVPIAHFDWYRLKSADEVLGLGWDDYLSDDMLVLVEWGDRFPGLLPPDARRLVVEIDGNARRIRWAAGE